MLGHNYLPIGLGFNIVNKVVKLVPLKAMETFKIKRVGHIVQFRIMNTHQ